MILSAIRKSKRVVRFIASFMVINLLIELAAPMQAFALTGGPSQPEVQSFEPVSANQMVDPFTGDFTYNIPLLDVGGYPINISYHAGPGLDEEASWVGLGWNINPGVINRNMRGIPDDFFAPDPNPSHPDNDFIKRTSKMQTSRTFGLNLSPSNEIFSQKTGNFLTLGIEYNNYKGIGFDVTGGQGGKFPYSVNFSSQNGLSANINYRHAFYKKLRQNEKVTGEDRFGYWVDKEWDNSFLIGNIGLGVNSRVGLTDLSLGFQKHEERQAARTVKRLGFNNREISSEGDIKTLSSKTSNGASSVSFLSSTYIPSSGDKNYTLSINVSLELGKEFYGINPDTRLGLSYSQSGVMKKDWTRDYPAYGFLNHSLVYKNFDDPSVEDKNKGKAIMDFNSYGASSLSKGEVLLPYSILTYDVLAVSGQGISGIYRAHSASVGTIYEQNAENRSIPPISLGFDLAGAATAKLGVDLSFNYFKSKSGRWKDDNDLFGYLNFANARSGADFEQVYFKNAGEKTPFDKDFYDAIDGGIPARPDIDAGWTEVKLKNSLTTWVNNPTVNANIIRNKRDKRNQVISTLSAKEAQTFGLIKYRSPVAKDHHIGQITALNPDGGRYVYAQPAYNTNQETYTFSFDDRVGGRTVDANRNIAWYAGGDNTTNNDLTTDQFFDYEKIPPYAHSYLLNAVLSPDYVDITNNGPSPDDNGSYTKIEYNKLSNVYGWRTPYAPSENGKFSANHQEGLHADQEDDKATLIFGQKEVFYMSKVETKTHIAFFYTSNRNDALGVTSVDGAKDFSNRLQKLDSIELYTTYDYYNYPLTKRPVKVVYFSYDYSLCPKVPNHQYNDSGKLTLKSIWFKNNNSNAGALSPYQFTYSSNNYDYGYMNYDRWGNYKATQSNPSNHEFPYSEQDETLANQYASAWSLTEITLPSGGKITVEYESDDYAYVQDKKAMEMLKIEGFNNSSDFSSSNQLYWNAGFNQNDYVFFKFKNSDNNVEHYLPEVSQIDNKRYLYLNAYIKLRTTLSSQDVYDYVRCYAEIIGYGTSSNSDYGFIQIKKVPMNETLGLSYGEVNPIAKNGWQFMRLNTPYLVYDGQNALRDKGKNGITIDDVYGTIFTVLGVIPEAIRALAGFNTMQIIHGRCREVDLNKSWMRLQSHNLSKKGGGLRVKKVLIDNQWSVISGEETQIFGQIYDYTYQDPVDGIISSGVASYEPQIGGDENPHKLPSFYTQKKVASLGQENTFFNDNPLGESLYPSPIVGYRQVKIRNIKPDEDGNTNTTGTITRHGTGYSKQKFFTAFDYPVYVTKTPVAADFKKSPVLSLLKLSKEVAAASQGFSIEINDMHGKPKSMETYDEYDKLISKTEYNYKTDPANRKRLINKVTTLKSDGTINRDANVGYEVEMVVYPRQLYEAGFSVKVNTDVDVFMIGIVPAFNLGFGLGLSGNYKVVKTATATKVINRYGILESVTVTDQSSSVTTTNKAFDDETGEVLLTETTNEFNNKVYNFTYPAHWAYDEGMGSAYKNIGAYYSSVSVSNGQANFTNADAEFITEGDELIANNGTETQVWVLDKHNNAGVNYTITFIDRYGDALPSSTYTLKNIRSGRRNMQTIPVGVIVGNTNPIPAAGSSFLVNGEVQMDAINASAASFSDHWQAYRHDPGCWSRDCVDEPLFSRTFIDPVTPYYCFLPPFTTNPKKFVAVNDKVNPYILGIKGNWRPDSSYVYFDRGASSYQRTQTSASTSFNGTNTATDGHLNTFKPFWFLNGSTWQNRGGGYAQTGNPWIWNSRAGQINPDGVELENVNALDITSSAIYSFISKQPLAVTYNAPLRETLFEGFEDYPTINYNVLECFDPGSPYSPYTQPTVTFGGDIEALKLITTPMQWYLWPALHFKTASPVQLGYIYDNDAHTGKKSLIVLNSFIEVPTQVYDKTSNPFNTGVPQTEYHINPEDLTDIFSPADDSKDYLLTYWVKAGDLNSAAMSIKQNATPISLTLLSESKPIEGWVKREYKFTFNTITTGDIISVKIANSAQTLALFDDIRIHPLEANMKSFVYDNKKLRLMATLDENNYATFFEYDEEGNLVRTKRETERGIITINENRQNIRH